MIKGRLPGNFAASGRYRNPDTSRPSKLLTFTSSGSTFLDTSRPPVSLSVQRVTFNDFGCDAIGICGTTGRGEGDSDLAPLGDIEATDNPGWQSFDDAHLIGLGVEDLDLAHSSLVRAVDDEAAVGGNIERIDIPAFFRPACGKGARLRIERAQPLEIRTFIRRHPKRAVWGKFPAAIGNVFGMIANGRHFASRKVEQRECRTLVTDTYCATKAVFLSGAKSDTAQPPPLTSATMRFVEGSRGFIT